MKILFNPVCFHDRFNKNSRYNYKELEKLIKESIAL
jgi:hypothetical protein